MYLQNPPAAQTKNRVLLCFVLCNKRPLSLSSKLRTITTTKPGSGVGKSHTDKDLGFLPRNTSGSEITWMTLCPTLYDRVADVWPVATQKQWQPLGSGCLPGSLLAISWKPKLPAAPGGAAARPEAHKPQYLHCSSALVWKSQTVGVLVRMLRRDRWRMWKPHGPCVLDRQRNCQKSRQVST